MAKKFILTFVFLIALRAGFSTIPAALAAESAAVRDSLEIKIETDNDIYDGDGAHVIHATMTVTNIGDEPVHNVNIQCVLPGYLTVGGGEGHKKLTSIAPGETVVMNFTAVNSTAEMESSSGGGGCNAGIGAMIALLGALLIYNQRNERTNIV